ncbi:serine/threonine-protein kinase pelle-like isoform X2 [Onthophagus taurus]|nr:serine/threonine-protein kinase pelle-like isoform X2 [Onthophagus taurus]
MQFLGAMEVLQSYVPDKFHRLMRKKDVKQINKVSDSKIGIDNFNNIENKTDNVKKVEEFLKPINIETRDDNFSDQKPPQRSPIPKRLNNSAFSAKSDISYIADSGIPHITYEELQKSTDNWNPGHILGKGGFGIVFKGTWKCTKVAIKRIEEKGSQSPMNPVRQTVTELNSLNAYRHDNILPLYGFSFDGPHNCLIYQYMSGGSLERRIRINDALNWESRLKIAIGSARGIQFLHTTSREPLIHGDIKPANILLDENDTPRIGDFGLARKGPSVGDKTHLTISHLQGTKPYLPDEYLRGGKLSTKVDTYSFGIVLFELATGLSSYSERRKNRFLKDHVVLYDKDIVELRDARLENCEKYFLGLINIGKRCTEQCPRERPEMVEALIALEEI